MLHRSMKATKPKFLYIVHIFIYILPHSDARNLQSYQWNQNGDSPPARGHNTDSSIFVPFGSNNASGNRLKTIYDANDENNIFGERRQVKGLSLLSHANSVDHHTENVTSYQHLKNKHLPPKDNLKTPQIMNQVSDPKEMSTNSQTEAQNNKAHQETVSGKLSFMLQVLPNLFSNISRRMDQRPYHEDKMLNKIPQVDLSRHQSDFTPHINRINDKQRLMKNYGHLLNYQNSPALQTRQSSLPHSYMMTPPVFEADSMFESQSVLDNINRIQAQPLRQVPTRTTEDILQNIEDTLIMLNQQNAQGTTSSTRRPPSSAVNVITITDDMDYPDSDLSATSEQELLTELADRLDLSVDGPPTRLFFRPAQVRRCLRNPTCVISLVLLFSLIIGLALALPFIIPNIGRKHSNHYYRKKRDVDPLPEESPMFLKILEWTERPIG